MRADKLNTEIRRAQIAQAALSLVASQGLRAMTVERVARLVGLVPSAIYRHFKGKEEVLDAVLDLIREKLLSNVSVAQEETSDPLEALRRLLMRHVRFILEYQAIPRILFSEDVYSGKLGKRAKLSEVLSDFLDAVADIFRKGQEQGRIRSDISPETLSVLFLGLFQPSAFLWHVTGGQFDIIKQTDMTWKVIGEALKSQK